MEVEGGYAVGRGDAIGMKKNGRVYFIEAKASQTDFTCRKQRAVENRLGQDIETWGAGIDFHYFILADGIKYDGRYPDWGIINEHGEVIRRAKRFKTTERGREELQRDLAHACSMRAYNYLLFPKIGSPDNSDSATTVP